MQLSVKKFCAHSHHILATPRYVRCGCTADAHGGLRPVGAEARRAAHLRSGRLQDHGRRPARGRPVLRVRVAGRLPALGLPVNHARRLGVHLAQDQHACRRQAERQLPGTVRRSPPPAAVPARRYCHEFTIGPPVPTSFREIFPTIDSLPASGLTPRTSRPDRFSEHLRFFWF